jgi:RHS repeat-associated protein
VPGTNDVIGVAIATNGVTVNGVTAYRKGEYFQALAGTNNSVVAEWLGITNSSAGNSTFGHVFVPRTPEQFTYDDDGNLLSDGRWNYSWDAENRLTKVESLSSGPATSKRRVTWEFDGQGRRIRQATHDLSNGDVVTEDLKFISDGWRHVAELNWTNSEVVRSYVWGSDLSGSMDGAGGVGGLLVMNSAANGAYFCAHDGNGNVAALVKASDGTVSARYEYEPFGIVLRATGPMADENRFQFSTKRCDRTTDLELYEYRVRRPDLAWLSRDPIEEEGGINLYAFVRNDPTTAIDKLGRRVVVEPASAVGEVVEIFNYLSDLESWAVGAEIHSHCDYCWVPRYPSSWQCLCRAITSEKVYRIYVKNVRTQPRSMIYVDGTTDTVLGPHDRDWPATLSDDDVQIPSKASIMTQYTFGFFGPGGNYLDAPLWRILAHELCGHALGPAPDFEGIDVWGDRKSHDVTIMMENAVALEHGAPARGLYSNQKQGESAWRLTSGKTVYYRNKPIVRMDKDGAPRAADYKLTLP